MVGDSDNRCGNNRIHVADRARHAIRFLVKVHAMDLRVLIDASPDVVWSHVSDLGSHSDWMSDAVRVEFETEQRSGEGTRMRVLTRVGPFRVTDMMTVVR